MADVWSDAENDICVAAYLDLLEAELNGRRLVKADLNARVQARTGRGRGGVEYKFQNVSAVLEEMKHPWVDGYKPARNYQDSLRSAVLRALSQRSSLAEAAFRSIVAEANSAIPAKFLFQLESAPRTQAPRTDIHWVSRAMQVDFVALEAQNRSLGLRGELAVVAEERRSLTAQGLPDLAASVEHVSQTRGDGLGYDVRSFTAHGDERLIEVKTTRRGKFWPMHVSRNEVRVSRRDQDRYEVHRLYEFGPDGTKAFVLTGSIADTCDLESVTYEAWPKAVG